MQALRNRVSGADRYAFLALFVVAALAIGAATISKSPRWLDGGTLVRFPSLQAMAEQAQMIVIGRFQEEYRIVNMGDDEHPSYVALRTFFVDEVVRGNTVETLLVAQRVAKYRPDQFVGLDHKIYSHNRTYLLMTSKSSNGDYWWGTPQMTFIVEDGLVYSGDLAGETSQGSTITVNGLPLAEFILALNGN